MKGSATLAIQHYHYFLREREPISLSGEQSSARGLVHDDVYYSCSVLSRLEDLTRMAVKEDCLAELCMVEPRWFSRDALVTYSAQAWINGEILLVRSHSYITVRLAGILPWAPWSG